MNFKNIVRSTQILCVRFSMDKNKTFDAQFLQQQFEQWHQLHQQLEKAQEQWQAAEKLWQELQEYYQSEQWLIDYENSPELTCREGEYSILAQDTLWNAMEERRQQAITWMKLGLKVVEQ